MTDPATEPTDAELLRAGTDAAAFAELYRRHVSTVHGWFRRRLEWALLSVRGQHPDATVAHDVSIVVEPGGNVQVYVGEPVPEATK